MFKKLIVLVTLGALLTGCFVAPLALLGPVTSGFSTASLAQSGFTSAANYMVKKSTGKSISEHAYAAISGQGILKQSYVPMDSATTLITPKPKPVITPKPKPVN